MKGPELAAWVAELRTRLDRGDFKGHPPILLVGHWTLQDPEAEIRSLLDELDAYDAMTSEEHGSSAGRGQRQRLGRAFDLLRTRLNSLPRGPWQG
jgi:hypothetical protein